MKSIINARIVTPTGVLEDHAIIFEEKIIAILSMKDYKEQNHFDQTHIYNEKSFMEIECEIDAQKRFVMPGFVDLHIHGSGGADVMDDADDALDIISSVIAKTGTTTFLATTMTMSKDKIKSSLDRIKKSVELGKFAGAKIAGAHMEGPFINPAYKGAQNAKYIIPADFEFIKDYTEIIKIITLAPEMDHNLEFIKKIKTSTDIIISLGHTNASFEQAKEAVECGASHITHLFNAMSSLNHRHPGVAGAGLVLDVTTELIADNIHVSPFLYSFLADNKKDKLILVTDCIKAGCMKAGEYDLGGQKVIVDENSARLEDNTLAGSILSMNKAVFNITKNSSIDITAAVNMASLYPATILGLEKSIGSLEKGKLSDIIVVSSDMNVDMTFINGKNIFLR